MISVIIPCHNRLATVCELVASIPKRDDIEVVLVDDYSAEDLTKIDLSEFPSHKYIRNNTSIRYAGSARNIGIENSSGEYLFFADSDDLIVADGFLSCIEILAKEKLDVLFAKAASFSDSNGLSGSRHRRNNWLVDEVISGADQSILVRFATPWAKFIRKEFIERHKIRFETQRVSNDIVFAAVLMINQPVVKVSDAVVYSIREGNDSLTNDFSIESSEIRLQALLRYNTVLASNGLRGLMAPALPLLIRLVRKSPSRLIYWFFAFVLRRQPALFNWWTLKNYWRRRWFAERN